MSDETPAEQNQRFLDLINATHAFPCRFTFKVIGTAGDEFVERVVETVFQAVGKEDEAAFSTRTTPNGRHVSVTLEPRIESAEEVLMVYSKIREVEGVVMTM